MTWKNSVNMPQVALVSQNPSLFVEEVKKTSRSPIDNFYYTSADINTKCTPSFLSTNGNTISGLMLVGLISATENYFRDILGYILSICPTSQNKSVEQKIQLGSVLWGGNDVHNKNAFEFMAFSNSKNVVDTFNGFLGYTVAQHGAWRVWLTEYDKLCELRHAVVHSDNVIAGKNAIKLDLQNNKKPLRIKVDYSNLQNASLVCTSMVQAANNELFEMMIKRWAESWRQSGAPSHLFSDKTLLSIRKMFLSGRDRKNNAISNRQADDSFISNVKSDFNL